MLIRRKGLEEQRRGLPDTVGKTSLFVKAILERYGQDGEYRFDPASFVYLLPEKNQEEEEKKEPEEERVREYVLRERETVKLATQTERTRDFVTRIVERTAVPSAVELLRQHSLKQQILMQTERILKECRETEWEVLHEQDEIRAELARRIQKLVYKAAKESTGTVQIVKESWLKQLAYQLTELIYETQAKRRESKEKDINEEEINKSHVTAESYEQDIQSSREVLAERIMELLQETAKEDRTQELVHQITNLVYETMTESEWTDRRSSSEALTKRITEFLQKTVELLPAVASGREQEAAASGREQGADVQEAFAQKYLEELAHRINTLVYETETAYRQSAGGKKDITGESSISHEAEEIYESDVQDFREVLTKKITELLQETAKEDRTQELVHQIKNLVYETMTESEWTDRRSSSEVLTKRIIEFLQKTVELLPAAASGREQEADVQEAFAQKYLEELAHRINTLVYETETAYRQSAGGKKDITGESSISHEAEEIYESDVQDFREVLTKKITELLQETAKENIELKILPAVRQTDAVPYWEWSGLQGKTEKIYSEELAYQIIELIHETEMEYRKSSSIENDIVKEINRTHETTEIYESDIQDYREVSIKKIAELLRETVKKNRKSGDLSEVPLPETPWRVELQNQKETRFGDAKVWVEAGKTIKPADVLESFEERYSEELAYRITELIYETQTEYDRSVERESDVTKEINKSRETTRNYESDIWDFREVLISKLTDVPERLAYQIAELVYETQTGYIKSEGRKANITDEEIKDHKTDIWNSREILTKKIAELLQNTASGQDFYGPKEDRRLMDMAVDQRENDIEELAYQIVELIYGTQTKETQDERTKTNITDETAENYALDIGNFREILTGRIMEFLQETAVLKKLHNLIYEQPLYAALQEELYDPEEEKRVDSVLQRDRRNLENGRLAYISLSREWGDSGELAYQIAELIYESQTQYIRSEEKAMDITYERTVPHELDVWDSRELLANRIIELLPERKEPEELAYQIAELVYEMQDGYTQDKRRKNDITDGITENHVSDIHRSDEVLVRKIIKLLKEADPLKEAGGSGETPDERIDGHRPDIQGVHKAWAEESSLLPETLKNDSLQRLVYQLTELLYEHMIRDGQSHPKISETIREFQKEIRTLERTLEGWQGQGDSVLEDHLPKVSQSVQRLIEYHRILRSSQEHMGLLPLGGIEPVPSESLRNAMELSQGQMSEPERILEIYQNPGSYESGSEEKTAPLQYYEEHSKKSEQLQKEQRDLIRRLEEKTAWQEEQFQELKARHRRLQEQLENSRKHSSENTEQKALQKFQEQLRLERMRRGLA